MRRVARTEVFAMTVNYFTAPECANVRGDAKLNLQLFVSDEGKLFTLVTLSLFIAVYDKSSGRNNKKLR